MKPLRLLSILFLGIATASAGDWKPLFNGDDLDGWTVRSGKATFEVIDGVIVGTTAPMTPNTFLCTDREYGDFELELEVKCDLGLNSGIQIRSLIAEEGTEVTNTKNPGKPRTITLPADRVYGYQVEIASAESGRSGGIYDEARRFIFLDELTDKPEAQRAFKDNEWNHFRIRCHGDHLQTWVNGVPCADVRDAMTASGVIGLQVHGNIAVNGRVIREEYEKHQVRFRNIRLRELDGNDHSSVLSNPTTRWALATQPAFNLKLDGQPEWKRVAPEGITPKETFGIAMAIDATNPARMVAGFRPQGVYRSEDAGRTWELIPGNPKTNGNFGVNSESLAFDPDDPDRIFIGYENAGVYWTSDFGATVTNASQGLRNKNVIAQAFDPKNPQRIFIGTDDGMHVSMDGGLTWKPAHGPKSGLPRRQKKEDHPTCLSLAFDPFDSKIIYSSYLDTNPGDEAGAYISRDGGKTWTASNNGLETGYRKPDPNYPFKIHAESGSIIRPSTVEKGVVYFATVSQGLWRSTDHGRQWTLIKDPSESGTRSVPALALHPENPDVFAIGDGLGIVFITRDRGKTWSPFANGLRVGREEGSREISIDFTSNDGQKMQLPALSREFVNKVEALTFTPDGKRLFAATSAGLYVVGFED
ncbi:MAG: family 16 glycoside hydrolase [Verrucomicrobiota bacterium]